MKLDKIHILFVLESFFPTHRAGTEIYVLNLCRYFKDKGWPVGVLVSTTQEMVDYEYEGIPVYTFLVPEKPIVKELNGIVPPRGLDLFIGRILDIQPDLVHFHSFGRAINGFHLQAAKGMGIKTAFTPHLATFFCPKGDLLYFGKTNCRLKSSETKCNGCILNSRLGCGKIISSLLGWGLSVITKFPLYHINQLASLYQARHRKNEIGRVRKHADLVFGLLPWMHALFIDYGVEQCKLVRQSLPEDFSAPIIHINPNPEKPLHVGFVGRIHPVKGFHTLIEAMKFVDASVWLSVFTVGNSNHDVYYNKQKTGCLSRGNVVWNENLSRQELFMKLQEIDVLVIPSVVTETGPLSLLEAWALKIPVVASDNMGILDQVSHGVDGLIFKMNDPIDFAQKLNSIVDDRSQIESLKSNIKIPRRFNEAGNEIEMEYMKLFNPIVEN
ncbi:MAG: glycosyltransferase [Breznakibacter sp.]